MTAGFHVALQVVLTAVVYAGQLLKAHREVVLNIMSRHRVMGLLAFFMFMPLHILLCQPDVLLQKVPGKLAPAILRRSLQATNGQKRW